MIENIIDFYKRIGQYNYSEAAGVTKGKPYFSLQEGHCHINQAIFGYRGFYKVTLLLETGKLYYADKWIMVDRPALMFATPAVPYAWEALADSGKRGWFCIFNEEFMQVSEQMGTLADSPLFCSSKDRIYFLDNDTLDEIQEIGRQIRRETASDYPQKFDVLRCYLHLLVHKAMMLEKGNHYVSHKNAAQRTVELFLVLLDHQFPVEFPANPLRLRSATDYAERLSIHVNHLNRVVKAVTGHTTSDLINRRIVQEAVALLQHSPCSISEIGWALGFNEVSSFSNYVKKHTGTSPSDLRMKAG